MNLECTGHKVSVAACARTVGLNASTVHGRLNRGWGMEKALETPADSNYCRIKSLTKNDAELWLNIVGFCSLPKALKQIVIKNKYNGKKHGQYLRATHRVHFDRWFASLGGSEIQKQA